MSSAMETTSCGLSPDMQYRRLLKTSVCALISEAGFGVAENEVLETVTEMLQSFLLELSRSSKAFSELSGRTNLLIGDVILALVEMGQVVDSIPPYARRMSRMSLPSALTSSATPEMRRLQVGMKRSHPSHISDFMPEFPDPHTYIKTMTCKPPVSEYQVVREKASAQKRDVERALTRFIAKTGDTENLFPDDPYAFPLIANKPKPLPYLEALLPKDHELDLTEQDDEEKRLNQQHGEGVQESLKTSTNVPSSPTAHVKQEPTAANNANGGDTGESEVPIDNPYLRPIVMPKLKGSSKKYR